MATKTIHAFTAITSIESADEILAWDDSANTTRKITWANALTNATLVTPTIASFANAQHTHANAAGGGTLTGYLAATGATTGATSQAQTFTNGLTTSGNVGILNTSPSTIGALNVSQENGEFTAIFGSDVSAITLTNATRKVARIGFPHITNAEEPVTFCFLNSDTGVNDIYLGGATGVGNAVTGIHFFTAANATTLTGSERMSIISSGNVGIGVTSPTAVLHVAASTTARASVCVVAGTAPTTPVVGDIWNDGALSFYNADATTNAIVNHLRLSRDSTGTAAAGLGLGILAELESTTTSRQSAGRLTWEWATATHASRAAKGKLTAYYTSTEREAITWVADSSSAKVGIMNAAPAAMLHVGAGADSPTFSETIGYFSNAGTTAIAVRDSTNDAEAVMYISALGAVYGTMTSHAVYIRTANNDALSILINGNVGIGVTSPQGRLHGHDGSGGFLFVNQASVGGTLVTVIPDGSGDVTERLCYVGCAVNSAGYSIGLNPGFINVGSDITISNSGNTLVAAVTAGGAFTLQATAGAATWIVLFWVFWR